MPGLWPPNIQRSEPRPQVDDRLDQIDYRLDKILYQASWFAHILHKQFYWKQTLVLYHEWREWAGASVDWSKARRSRAKRSRRLTRILLAPAVLGAALMAYYCTLSMPVEHWWVGMVGIILVVPYLTRRLS